MLVDYSRATVMEQFEFLREDEALYRVIQQIGELEPRLEPGPFVYLLRTVAGQQLSVKAAASIFARFLELLPAPTPENVLALTPDQLRAVGYSYGKASYLHNIAQFWMEHGITETKLQAMTDEEVIALLTQIKGVGRWSVEIMLAFSLGRPDIFFVDDLGIQQGMSIIYGWDTTDKKTLRSLMLEKASKYSPHTTAVCRYIWAWKNRVKSGLAVSDEPAILK